MRTIGKAKRSRRRNERKIAVGCHGGECLAQPHPFALPAQPFFGLVAAGAEIENLRIARIGTKRTRPRTHATAQIGQVIAKIDVTMREALQFLERDGVGPKKLDRAPIRTHRTLRQIAGFAMPFRMMGAGIVPIHQKRTIPGVEIKSDEAGGIGLFVDQRRAQGVTPSKR